MLDLIPSKLRPRLFGRRRTRSSKPLDDDIRAIILNAIALVVVVLLLAAFP